MNEVLVEERAAAAVQPPTFKIAPEPVSDSAPREGEDEWISNVVGRGRKVRLLVSGGDMGSKEVAKLIKLLEAQKAVLDDDEDEAGEAEVSDGAPGIGPCCFCGRLDYDYPDPTYVMLSTRSEVTKTWWCHVACFEERLPELPEPWSVYDRDADTGWQSI